MRRGILLLAAIAALTEARGLIKNFEATVPGWKNYHPMPIAKPVKFLQGTGGYDFMLAAGSTFTHINNVKKHFFFGLRTTPQSANKNGKLVCVLPADYLGLYDLNNGRYTALGAHNGTATLVDEDCVLNAGTSVDTLERNGRTYIIYEHPPPPLAPDDMMFYQYGSVYTITF